MKWILASKGQGEQHSRQQKGMCKDSSWGSSCSWGVPEAKVPSVCKEHEEPRRELKMRLTRGQGQIGKALVAMARYLDCILSTVASL